MGGGCAEGDWRWLGGGLEFDGWRIGGYWVEDWRLLGGGLVDNPLNFPFPSHTLP